MIDVETIRWNMLACTTHGLRVEIQQVKGEQVLHCAM
jgi:hypothetical protein